MEKLSYTETEKKKYRKWEYNARIAEHGYREEKLVRPICTVCQGDPAHRADWFLRCEHAQAAEDAQKTKDGKKGGALLFLFWSRQPKIMRIPTMVEDEDGDLIVEETITKTKLILVPNLVTVPADVTHNDGQGVTKSLAKGYLRPMDAGIAPYCQYSGCGKQWPLYRVTGHGDFCNEYQAKISVANDREIHLTAPGWGDPKRREQQILEVQV